MNLKEWISKRHQETLEIAKVRQTERRKQLLLTALYTERAKGKRARHRADFDFWRSLHKDLSTTRSRKDIRKNIDRMIF